eukprot:10898406-Alexandrium_andersonii.AAC.1
MFAEAQPLPRSGVSGKNAKRTRPVMHGETVDTAPLDGIWTKNGLPWDEEFCLYAHPADTWWDAVVREENQQRNCRAPTGPLPYNGLRLRLDLADAENPGGVFAAWGTAPKITLNEYALELLKIFTHHLVRDTFKDMSMRPDKHLDELELHDVRRVAVGERWQLAMRMLQRTTLKQERAHFNTRGTDWVLHGAEVPQRFLDEYAGFTVDVREIPGMRNDLTRGFRDPRDSATRQLQEKVA